MGGASCSRALAGLNSVATNKCWASQENPLSWLNSTKHFIKLKDQHEVFSCLVQCHTGHAYMSEFWRQFFPVQDIACVYRENLQTCKCIIRFASDHTPTMQAIGKACRTKLRDCPPRATGHPQWKCHPCHFPTELRHVHIHLGKAHTQKHPVIQS